MRSFVSSSFTILVALVLGHTAPGFGPSALAQPSSETGPPLNLTIGEGGLSIGDSEHTTGIRLNYRARALERVTGVNLTLGSPYA